jgi:hypothetical protein
VVIGRRGHGLNATFTVRRISYGEGVERVFPLHSPRIDKVEVERRGMVRRAKLTYLRKRIGKAAVAVKERAQQSASGGRRCWALPDMHCIVTTGPTAEPLDEVRRLTNASTGRLGPVWVSFSWNKGAG